MKKFYFIAAAAIAVMASCSKVEFTSTPDKTIGYQVASYANQTKAGETSFLSELEELGITSSQAFKSKAFIHAAQANGTVAAPVAFYSPAIETISWDSTNHEWAPSHVYYWPKSPKSSISFFSWYDYNGGSAPTDPTITYTADGAAASMAWTNRTVALKDNLLYADAAHHYKANATTYGKDSVEEGVPTLFRHALAKVRFTAAVTTESKVDTKNPTYSTFWVVKLSDVALADGVIKNNGNFTASQTAAASTNTVQTWTSATWADAASQTYLSTLNTTTVFNTNVAKGTTALTTSAAYITPEDTYMDNYYFTVRPQTIANGVILTFKFSVETYYGLTSGGVAGASQVGATEVINVNDYGPSGANLGSPYTNTGIQLNAMGASPITSWEPNHRYIYNITINPETTTILYDPAVEAWAAEENADIEVVPTA